MARSQRGTRGLALVAALALAPASLLASGCGSSEEAPDTALENAATPPSGTLIETKASLKGGAKFSSLATADNRARGTGEALIVGVIAISKGSPEFRLLLDG